MIKWLKRGLLLGLSTLVISFAYGEYRGGFYSLPELPDDAYAISFKNGFKAILYDFSLEEDVHVPSLNYFRRLNIVDQNRRYLGIPTDVSPWFEEMWSHCVLSGQEAKEYIESTMTQETRIRLAGARFEAMCLIEADGQKILRGALYSIPRTSSPIELP